MTSKLPMVGIRLAKLSYRKFRYIAHTNGRWAAQEGRLILLKYIEQYERKHGKITLEQLEQLEERMQNEKQD